MMKLIRRMISSKAGVVVTIALLVLIALAFGLSDVANHGSFGGVSGADRVAIVGDQKVSTSELSKAATAGLNDLRQRNPTATMESYIAAGGLDQALQRVIDTAAFGQFGRKIGLRAGDRLIDSEIAQITAFQGPNGKFDENAYQNAIRQQGLSDADVRKEIASVLLARQVSAPVDLGARLPLSLARRYASLLQERRKGEFGILTSAAYAPTASPTDAQLQAYYTAHRTDYLRPERRVIRYATFGDEALANVPAPTDAEIAARYQRDQAQYAASQKRKVSMLVLPTQAAAKAVKDEVAKGKSLDAAASEKGLRVSHSELLKQDELAAQNSAAVAQAAFATAKGAIAEPVRGALGYYVIRVDEVQSTPGRSLEQVRPEIVKALTAEKRKLALADLSSQVENEIDDGNSLAELAKQLNMKIETTPELTADGRVYGAAGATAPPILARALSTAFTMDEGEPQIADLGTGGTFLVFEVGNIVPSAAAPLAEIKSDVAVAWKKAQGDAAAKEAAKRVMDRLAKGSDLATALKAEGKALPPQSNVDLTRQDLSKAGGKIPSVLALFFSMAQGTVKRLEAPDANGWFVVKLDQIIPGQVKDDDPTVRDAQRDLGQVAGNEYGDQFLHAIELDVGVEKHQSAIDAVKNQLTGRNQQQ
jgi:peptidyl-prolyl cis-trans isomerase D